MILKELLEELNYEVVQGSENITINEVNYDSRLVKKGDLFVCIKGFQVDGHKYVNAAVEKGAIAIVCEDLVQCEDKGITIIRVKESRKALAIIGCNFYENPSKKMKIIGVTGTNGKTTTTFMLKTILESAGKKVGLVGTIANYIGNKKLDTERTTPESFELQKLFSEMVKNGCEYCVMEVSSHSLALDRVYGIEFDAGIFTNITRDHLDFHKTFENYYSEKFKLFQRSSLSVVNIDDNYGKDVVKDLKNQGKNNIVTFSIKEESDFRAYDEKCESKHIGFKLKLDREEDFLVGMPGEFNIYNSLGAIAAMYKLGISLDSIKKGIEEVVVLGRCEMVGRKYNLPYTIIVDYAHTPDGLDNILKTAKGFTKNRLISVFGCGGDRDKVKRPQMGKIGSDLSDIAIVTSDNPRTEEPMSIINDVLVGIDKDNYEVIENRKEAIKRAIEIAEAGDVVVIAGKGHEDYQILNTGKIHFDEREVVDEILKSRM
ncbi:UDP-N-acetylmuramoyl-L-alanyl-D-glutamate--2,6-diaminopimelate ligase [Clostridium cibarium]|uniref:UDP-N-acetylmuramoyl-L-alanyl-D-glutamate--2,6-diaminopimelate ligase n=1 Tax=Clostridium cibarium TaxID=2762247 RepID=A0ABR8PPI2_9CLOT|nr:UDP-N-acetylmuramoyl-L-alanyl-D-glutamate--2,6-diaminopimelate ligase [Clostridium cibarium]MBD7910065.1 UDP-N-acetylmuramoyl-L-alanyl-D-glutamate--2,6-diaminopimelate ligase [Clostridium cibarium]